MIFFTFVLWFLLAEGLIFLARFLLSKTKPRIWLDIVFIIVELLSSVGLALLVMAGPMAICDLHSFLMALYVALMMDALAKIVFMLVNIPFQKEKKLVPLTIITNCLGVAFLTFGIVNMEIVAPRYLTFESSKLTREYKVAFVSDLHIGSAQPASVAIDTLRKINAENPDLTIIGGDLADGYTNAEDLQNVLSACKEFTSPVYYVYGNHDPEMPISTTEFEDCLTRNNIIILKDQFVSVGSDFTLLGRYDQSLPGRKSIDALSNPYPNTCLLVADHEPFAFEDNCKLGTDFQLSGHTHAGQLFPLNLGYRAMGVPSYGAFHHENAILNVSSGASGWRVPLRTEIGCQYEVITFKPAQ